MNLKWKQLEAKQQSNQNSHLLKQLDLMHNTQHTQVHRKKTFSKLDSEAVSSLLLKATQRQISGHQSYLTPPLVSAHLQRLDWNFLILLHTLIRWLHPMWLEQQHHKNSLN